MDKRHERDWEKLVKVIYDYFSKVSLHNTLYRVNVESALEGQTLYSVFKDHIDYCTTPNYYNCRQCRDFINTYGNLVYFSNGIMKSALFPDLEFIPDTYITAVYRLTCIIEHAPIIDVFKTHMRYMGKEESGGFEHLHIKLPKQSVSYIPKESDVNTVIAAHDDIFMSLKDAINSYDIKVIETGRNILNAGYLPSTDVNVINLLSTDFNWFERVFKEYKRSRDDSLLWEAVGEYGFRAYINHSLLGSFLEYAKVFMEKGII